MKAKMRFTIVVAAMLVIGGAVGYVSGRKSADFQLGRSARTLALAQAAKETALDTRLLEGLRDGRTDVVIGRLEAMLDSSIIEIGIWAEFDNAPDYVDEAVSRSLCLARNYRAVYPHRPSKGELAKYYDAALALKGEDK